MKNILILLVLISTDCFGQGGPKNSGIDSATLRDNILLNWTKGVPTERGSVLGGGSSTLTYDPIYGSYYSIASGVSKIGPGRWNLVIGENAGDSMTNDANYNTFLGKDCGRSNKTGDDNFFAGWDAGYHNTSGNANIGFPQDALYSNTRGSNNVALGRGAQYSNMTGNHNISAGWQSLYYLTGGEENVALGGYAGAFLLKGSGNIYIGAYAGEHNDAAVGKTINDAIYIGRYTGLSSAHSRSINIGYNIQSTGDGKINIGNVYKGDVSTGVAEVNSISISGKQVTFDDNYMYVQTSTGQKRVPLQEVTAATKAVTTQSNQRVAVYGTDGKLVGYATFQLK